MASVYISMPSVVRLSDVLPSESSLNMHNMICLFCALVVRICRWGWAYLYYANFTTFHYMCTAGGVAPTWTDVGNVIWCWRVGRWAVAPKSLWANLPPIGVAIWSFGIHSKHTTSSLFLTLRSNALPLPTISSDRSQASNNYVANKLNSHTSYRVHTSPTATYHKCLPHCKKRIISHLVNFSFNSLTSPPLNLSYSRHNMFQ